jgi:hypothetical protein
VIPPRDKPSPQCDFFHSAVTLKRSISHETTREKKKKELSEMINKVRINKKYPVKQMSPVTRSNLTTWMFAARKSLLTTTAICASARLALSSLNRMTAIIVAAPDREAQRPGHRPQFFRAAWDCRPKLMSRRRGLYGHSETATRSFGNQFQHLGLLTH